MSSSSVDEGHATPRWEFDEEVTRVFDNMLARSIPQYDVMRQVVLDLAMRYAKDGTDIVDLGCSRGEAMGQLEEQLGERCNFIGVEVSKPMLEASRDRFKDKSHVAVYDFDLRKGYPQVRASVTLAVLVVQFTPIEYRQRIVRDIYRHTLPGGCCVLVEKVLGATAELDRVMVETYLESKAHNGYDADQIERKRLSLEGVLVPVTARWNEELLTSAGFRDVDCVWRWHNFAAWLAVKDA
jgi:tRNA (cmo5U34)-methyltransferase